MEAWSCHQELLSICPRQLLGSTDLGQRLGSHGEGFNIQAHAHVLEHVHRHKVIEVTWLNGADEQSFFKVSGTCPCALPVLCRQAAEQPVPPILFTIKLSGSTGLQAVGC